MCYNYTTNLGNEIQSIAARRFLPKIDYYIEHEKLQKFNEGNNVKMIMNGWFLDCAKAWPPSDNIEPLLISMHFASTSTKERKEAILTDESKDFLTKYGPVGCRDSHTVDFLKDNGIDAFYSGCLTLTLDSGNLKVQNDDDKKYIVINVENPNELCSYLKQKSDKKIFVIYQDLIPSFKKAYPETMKTGLYTLTSLYDWKEKLFMAENLLKLYENAYCAITDRMHCVLPCLALDTPVLLLRNNRMKERFYGMDNLFHESTFEEYLNDYNIFDVDNPIENPKNYLKIRNDLIKRCKQFTGTVNDSCYADISYQKLLETNAVILSKNAIETRNYISDIVSRYRSNMHALKDQEETIDKLKAIIKDQEQANDELEAIIKNQEMKINSMESSNSWKLTKPLRDFRNKLK